MKAAGLTRGVLCPFRFEGRAEVGRRCRCRKDLAIFLSSGIRTNVLLSRRPNPCAEIAISAEVSQRSRVSAACATSATVRAGLLQISSAGRQLVGSGLGDRNRCRHCNLLEPHSFRLPHRTSRIERAAPSCICLIGRLTCRTARSTPAQKYCILMSRFQDHASRKEVSQSRVRWGIALCLVRPNYPCQYRAMDLETAVRLKLNHMVWIRDRLKSTLNPNRSTRNPLVAGRSRFSLHGNRTSGRQPRDRGGAL